MLLKLIFTKEPLSIQVHPDDAYARSVGLEKGKTEAWYILSAAEDATVALGLKRKVTAGELRTSIEDGSIEELMQRRPVQKDDVIFVPAGTIHAIGPGLVLAEIQQRSEATFRLFDHGRGRDLHVDNAVAAAHPEPAGGQSAPKALGDGRTQLIASRHFVLERLDVTADSQWELNVDGETWLLGLEGDASVGSLALGPGEAVFLQADRATLSAGSGGFKGLMAYPGPEPIAGLLRRSDAAQAGSSARLVRAPPLAWGEAAGQSANRDAGTRAKRLARLAFIGNSLPRHCGIATFTTDLQQAVAASRADVETCIVAMNDHGHRYDYPPEVRFQVDDGNIDDYVRAAGFLNSGRFDAVSLQHEFGIFGGEAGGHILALLNCLTMPVVTTLHTVVSAPTPAQRSVLGRIIDVSSKLIVMTEKGRELLREVYQVPADKIEVIAHGIPDFAFVEPDAAKAKFGFQGRTVILTFGLLSPNKGIEFVIDAMPAILECRADAAYVVLGATHPNLVRDQGEAYRESLVARARRLGVQEHVVFLDQFVDQPTLLDYISMCDIYVTPYLNEAQMTSGTLAYSFGLGKAVVSTPYWHARELLADGRGLLVPFGDAAATGDAIVGLLNDDTMRQAMRECAYANSRTMTWERTAERYLSVFESARRGHRLTVIQRPRPGDAPRQGQAAPPLRMSHLVSMCDDTGLLQHAVHSIPERSHGYCVDDNARALLLACMLDNAREERLPEALTGTWAAFVQHAWNPDTRRFRNFMSFDRRWLEDKGSQDSHGRSLWALGECARSDSSPSRRRWAAALFAEALPAVDDFDSPRAWAFSLLGLNAYCAAAADASAERRRRLLADRLTSILALAETRDWTWFEDGLAYDNARLPQALIATGACIDAPAYIETGLRSLRWLMALQTTPSRLFRPVGSDSFGDKRTLPKPFDQQPLEAAAAISACVAAWRVTGDAAWGTHAERAFAWFLGGNDLSLPLVDLDTGSCRDGLHPDRANENRGAESALSYLLALVEIRQLDRASGHRMPAAPLRVKYPDLLIERTEVTLVSRHIPEPAGSLSASRSGTGGGAPIQAGDRAARLQSDGQDAGQPRGRPCA
ncbi:MAG TPA: glycosyltransferase [Burkholderiales bacterium]|nr:glycosyltransferase [Burkholderiales bacterium]